MLDNSRVRAVIGPVGSGKSSACVVEIVRRAYAQAPGADGKRRSRWVIVRNTGPQLRDTTRKTFSDWIPDEWGTWHESSFTFRLSKDDVEAEILFRALDRPQDVRRLLSLEVTGAYINEAREIPKTVFDVLESRIGRYPPRRDGVGPTWFGMWMDSNPWTKRHWGYQLFSIDRLQGYALFEQPGGRTPQAENTENLVPNYYRNLIVGKDETYILSYVDGKYPAADEGSVYGRLLEYAGDLQNYEFSPDNVFTSWDIGHHDSTAIWFWKFSDCREPLIVDYYENHSQPLSHYIGVIMDKGYSYIKHYLPHDARAKTFQTGVSTLELAQAELGVDKVEITPHLSLADGIGATRWFLERKPAFHKNCQIGVNALRAYHYGFDEDSKSFSKLPVHDWSSHCADAARYMGVVVKELERMTHPKHVSADKCLCGHPARFHEPSCRSMGCKCGIFRAGKSVPLARPVHKFHLEELWSARERSQR